jgi:hypothetical protein
MLLPLEPMSDEELAAYRARVARQIEILWPPLMNYDSSKKTLHLESELKAILAAIDLEIARRNSN